jgi:hypothetical protein
MRNVVGFSYLGSAIGIINDAVHLPKWAAGKRLHKIEAWPEEITRQATLCVDELTKLDSLIDRYTNGLITEELKDPTLTAAVAKHD